MIDTNDSQARLLKVVGAPTAIRGCGEGNYRFPTDGGAGETVRASALLQSVPITPGSI
jgi:hypothetical protein